jgi:putative heme iron utilization protein
MENDARVRQPGEGPTPLQPADFEPVGEGKALLRESRTATLATLDRESGHPFATLATTATDMDGSPTLLLSALAAHSANIAADPRVSLLLARGGRGDPLAHPRLTLTGRAYRDDAPRRRRRFLARHPKAGLYADFADFAVFGVEVLAGHLNGGFARAARLSPDELLTDLAGADALVEAEDGAVEHMNADHADAIGLYATVLLGRRAGSWRMTGIDPEGADLASGDETARLPFPLPVRDPGTLRTVLKDLASRARGRV